MMQIPDKSVSLDLLKGLKLTFKKLQFQDKQSNMLYYVVAPSSSDEIGLQVCMLICVAPPCRGYFFLIIKTCI